MRQTSQIIETGVTERGLRVKVTTSKGTTHAELRVCLKLKSTMVFAHRRRAPVAVKTATADQATAVPSLIAPLAFPPAPALPEAPGGEVAVATGPPSELLAATLPVV
jgi:hypothetical protein